MKISDVRWKNAVSSAGIAARDAYDEIERIREKHGGQVSPQDLVAESKGSDAVLHPYFEWSQRKAADEFRLLQARRLMRSLVVVYAERPDSPTRAYEISVKKDRKDPVSRTIYVTSESAMKSPEVRDRLITEAIRAMMEFKRRFQVLHELRDVMSAIEEAITSIGESA